MTIRQAKDTEAESLFQLLQDCRLHLEAAGVFQWTAAYPDLLQITTDIRAGHVYVTITGLAMITLNEQQEAAYATVNWEDKAGRPLVVHRLAVHPQWQGKGLARLLMDFATRFARENKYSSIRLDAYSGNQRSLDLYASLGYQQRGTVYFAGRELAFYCYELLLSI